MKNPYITQTQEDLQFFGSGSRIVLGSILLESGKKNTWATFDVFVRDMPKERNYLVASGINDVINFLKNFKFSKKQIKYLKENLKLSRKMEKYLRTLKLQGDVWAVPEGSIVFPNEPIIRLTVPLIFAGIIEQYVINTIMHQTMLASKLSRVVTSAKEKVVGFVPVRTHGIDSALKAVRIGKMLGFGRADMLMSSFRENTPTSGGLFTTHYFMLSFNKEIKAFEALANNGGNNMAVLIDTYNFMQGIKNFIDVALRAKQKGVVMRAIAIDSGDLFILSKIARKKLDEAELKEVKIVVASNLDEYSINNLVRKNAPIDIYAPCTEILNVTDAPKLEVVYKMSEIIEDKTVSNKMKFSPGKISIPGRKQIFRLEKNGKYVKDTIAMCDEKCEGMPLLNLVIKNGKLKSKVSLLEETKKYYRKEILKFSNKILSIDKKYKYKVSLSPKLSMLTNKMRKKHFIT